MTRIAEALERIATALEQRPVLRAELLCVDKDIPSSWVATARRVVDGEKVIDIARQVGVTSSTIRMRVLKVFRSRNPNRYDELKGVPKEGRPYSAPYGVNEPLMRDLIAHAKEFGF